MNYACVEFPCIHLSGLSAPRDEYCLKKPVFIMAECRTSLCARLLPENSRKKAQPLCGEAAPACRLITAQLLPAVLFHLFTKQIEQQQCAEAACTFTAIA